jgi:hypothetical protein
VNTSGKSGGENPFLFFGGFFIQVWGGYLLWQGLSGHSVFSYGPVANCIGFVGIIVLMIGLFLPLADLIGLVLNVVDGRDLFEESVIWSSEWLLNPFFLEAIAYIFLMVAGAILVGFGWLIKEIFLATMRQFRESAKPA